MCVYHRGNGGGFTEEGLCRGEWHSPIREELFITEGGVFYHRGREGFSRRKRSLEDAFGMGLACCVSSSAHVE